MKQSALKKLLIGGIGNVLLGDDGVGPYIARLLAAHYEFEDGVEVADLGTPALDLIDQLTANDAVILIDSVNIEGDPGTVELFRKSDIMRQSPAVRMDPHSPALVDAMLSAEMFGVAPAEVLLVGIRGESFEPGCDLSQPVKASLGEAIAQVLIELDRLHVQHRLRQQPEDLGIWWARISAEAENTEAEKKMESPLLPA